MSRDQDLGLIFDGFSASELHSTFLLVRVLIRFSEAAQHRLESLKKVSLSELVAAGLSLSQINDAVLVLKGVQKRIDEKMNIGAVGISVIHHAQLTLSENGDVVGFSMLPLNQIDQILSKREHEFPQWGDKTNVRVIRVGDVKANGRSCSLTAKEFKYILFMRAPLPQEAKKRSLKTVGSAVDATGPNASRDISTINNKLKKDLGLPYDFIDHRDSAGYFLNTERYNILFD